MWSIIIVEPQVERTTSTEPTCHRYLLLLNRTSQHLLTLSSHSISTPTSNIDCFALMFSLYNYLMLTHRKLPNVSPKLQASIISPQRRVIEVLRQDTGQVFVNKLMGGRNWIGHTVRKFGNYIARYAIRSNLLS